MMQLTDKQIEDGYDNCENCDFGYWKTYKKENK